MATVNIKDWLDFADELENEVVEEHLKKKTKKLKSPKELPFAKPLSSSRSIQIKVSTELVLESINSLTVRDLDNVALVAYL